MKKIWTKKRFQKTGHSRRTFGRFTHVFRSCRKQSYDSENGEEEAVEPQIPQEQGPQEQRLPAGESDRYMDTTPVTTPSSSRSTIQQDERSNWSGSQQTVVEKEVYNAVPVQGAHLHPNTGRMHQGPPQVPRGLPEAALKGENKKESTADMFQRKLAAAPKTQTLEPTWRSPVLPPPSPKPGQRAPQISSSSTQPSSRTTTASTTAQPSTPLTPRKKILTPSDYQDVVTEEFEEKVKKPKSSALSQASTQESRPQTPLSETSSKASALRPSPKLVRAGSKIFDKVKYFEERRKSFDRSESPLPMHSWLPIRKSRSFDQPELDDHDKIGMSETSREDLREVGRTEAGSASLRRSAFRQKAASFDERGKFASRVYDIELKFSEELSRIKRSVSKQHLMRSQELLKDVSKGGPQVVTVVRTRPSSTPPFQTVSAQKPRAFVVPAAQLTVSQAPHQQRTPELQTPITGEFERRQQTSLEASAARKPLVRSLAAVSRSAEMEDSDVISERTKAPTSVTAHIYRQDADVTKGELVQPLVPTATYLSPQVTKVSSVIGRKTPEPKPQQESHLETNIKDERTTSLKLLSAQEPLIVQSKQLPVVSKIHQITTFTEGPSEDRDAAHQVQKAPTGLKEAVPQAAQDSIVPVKPKPGEDKVTPRGLGLVGVDPLKPAKPQLVGEDRLESEDIIMGHVTVKERSESVPSAHDGKADRSKRKGRRIRPTSPDIESSDDSYKSAGEDPLEPPVFEIPIQDTTVTAGSEVLLKCIITGTPIPAVFWKKDGSPLKSSPTHLTKIEGERYTLLIKCARPSDAGVYSVTAVNEEGVSSCSATVKITEIVSEHRGYLGVPMELSSPITSDEEYLSPLEEGMDFGGSPYRSEPAFKFQDLPELSPKSPIEICFKAAPTFEVALSDQSVLEGQDVSLNVRVHGEPKPMVCWLRNRQPIKIDSKHYSVEGENGSCTLYIIAVQKVDSGVYGCKAINEYGTKQCEAKLEVKAQPEVHSLAVVAELQDITVSAGEMALFECQVTGPPDMDVDWLSSGKLLQPALLNCKMHYDGKKCKLLLNSVHEDDSGIYTCKLSTAKDELNCSARLTVNPSIEPLFTKQIHDLDVIEGRTARFDCKVSGTPPPLVTWTHFGHEVTESENIRLVKERGLHSLIISHVSSENEGEYTVSARNPHGEVECCAELYVEEPRPAASLQSSKLEKMPSIPEEPESPENETERFTMPDFVKPLHDLDVFESKDAVLECQVTGLPYPTITWFHNGQKIESTEDRKMTQYKDVHRLVFHSVSHLHAGVYKSVIANKVGKAACYAHLYVTDVVPSPPDGPPTVTAVTGRTVTLKWNKPKRLDPAIDPASINYIIQQQILGSSQWNILATNLKDTSYTINALTKGVQYIFRVITAAPKTCSKPSPPCDPVQLLDRGPYLDEAPLILDKPDLVYVVENQTASITITLNHIEADIQWKRGDISLESRAQVHEMSMPDDDQHSLKIFKVTKNDVGELTCIATNVRGSDSCMITMEFAESPRFESIMEDIDISCGETARFAVVVEGKPVPDIMWYKNDVLLSESSHLTFVYDDNECSLVILNTTEEDSGVYTCTAKNLAGEVSCKAELTVQQVQPTTDITMEDEQARLHRMRRLTDYYDIHKEIGRGAFSYVKKVTEKNTKLDYAAKFISGRAKAIQSACREMNILSQLDHERIVYFHDAFEKTNCVIIIMELCTQEDMLDRMTKKSSVTESEVRSYMRQILDGICYLHRNNIMHLDIKPENILMADTSSEQIRICDFGNAQEVMSGESQYCRYGTPEFVAPEIVAQTPVTPATDVWSVGVVAYLCLTGISPFVGENDKATLMNINNYNVAFEEKMFTDLTREAKNFVINVLVNDNLRPNAEEALKHPWFKTLAKGKSINTDHLKRFLSRRKWQRSLIRYKSNMVMRSIPELLQDMSGHQSIAIPKHLKESSVLSSSSDSDDIDDLPFIPMPLEMEVSGSRVSLNEIPTDEEIGEKASGTQEQTVLKDETPMEWETTLKDEDAEQKKRENNDTLGKRKKGLLSRKRSTEAEGPDSSDEEMSESQKRPEYPGKSLKKGSSLESPEIDRKTNGSSKKGELRRGSSADSALLLHILSDNAEKDQMDQIEEPAKPLKKAASMELPRRCPSPGRSDERGSHRRKLSPAEEDYALRLELMRQRLLRGGSVDSKISGLRGPLLETLGMGDEKKRTASLDRQTRPPRPEKMTRAASSETAPKQEEPQGEQILRKSASFSQGDAEPVILHRRSGAPLEIPIAHLEARQRLKESPSLSALTDQTKFDSRPPTPKEISSKPPTPELENQKTDVESEKREQDERVTPKESVRIDDTRKQEMSSTSTSVAKPHLSLEEYSAESPTARLASMPLVPPRAKGIEPISKPTKAENKLVTEPIHSTKDLQPSASVAGPTPVSKVPISIPQESISVSLPKPSPYAETMQPILIPVTLTSPKEKIIDKETPKTEGKQPMESTTQTPLTEVKSSGISHTAVFSKVAATSEEPKAHDTVLAETEHKIPQVISSSTEKMNIENIDSEEIFEARFKRSRESSLTKSLKLLKGSRSEEKLFQVPPVYDETVYHPGPVGTPLEVVKLEEPKILEERSKSVQDLREAEKDSSFMRRLSLRLKKAQTTEQKEKTKEAEQTQESASQGRRFSWNLGRGSSKDRRDSGSTKSLSEADKKVDSSLEHLQKEPKKHSESPVLMVRKKIESTMDKLSMKLRSHSEERKESDISRSEKGERKEEKHEKRTPLLSLLRRSSSEDTNLKRLGIPQNQLASQVTSAPSSESLQSESSIQSETAAKGERKSRWDRWGLSRGRKDKVASQPNIPASILSEDGTIIGRQYVRNASDFPPIFHIKLKDFVILEGESVTLCCLPAANPTPYITWTKDKRIVERDDRVQTVCSQDGRQMLTITKARNKDAGMYECVATNPLGTAASSCSLAVARIPGKPGTPEIPQKYKNTVLVLWKPADSLAPCTYTLERKMIGENEWKIISSGIADCYYNVTELPLGAMYKFRVACVNKAGQGPYSNSSEKVHIEDPEQRTQNIVQVSSTKVVPVPAVTPSISVSPENSKTFFPLDVPPTRAEAVPMPLPKPVPTPPARRAGRSVPATPPTVPKAVPTQPPKPQPTTVSLPLSNMQATATIQLITPPAPTQPLQTEVATTPYVPIPAFKSTSPTPEIVPALTVQPTSPVNLEPPRIITTRTSPVSPTSPPTITSITLTPANLPTTLPPSMPVYKVTPVSTAPPAAPTYFATSFVSVPPVTPTTATTSIATGTVTSSTSSVTFITPIKPYQPPQVPMTVPTRVIVKSATPGREGSTPTRFSPTGRPSSAAKEGTALRQGVPQKPYTFLDEKARGRFGVIRECKENASGKHFMAKIIPYEADSKQIVLQEYEILKSLRHEKIVALHEAYITPRYLVLISENCMGKELLYSLTDRFRYSEDDVVGYIVQLLQGLDYLHSRRIVHLDIKPDNLIVSYMNVLKIIDFGSAQTFNPLVPRKLGRRIGTLEYMSPEMVKGDVIGPAADVWGLGVLTYIMLSGRSPFAELDPLETENRIQSGRFDIFKLYPNASQSASLFLKKILCIYPWSRPTVVDCFSNPWLQDAYLMKLRRQTLTFTTTKLKEFLVEHQKKRSEVATKHQVLLRSYHGTQQPPAPVTQ
ncbi:striated muscle preferentially expressed protein kinase isoform X2 [Protopterus annectens]|uniref:striated muscle preferentially expressed protein kinase isoform X2 n=1 Tax=Protopterus annectens TaxID=7888 RepID=UPI001CFC0BF3|nr:striated muscle preferentially expressed protein kinase isoform X2 [Protopterus annectens]